MPILQTHGDWDNNWILFKTLNLADLFVSNKKVQILFIIASKYEIIADKTDKRCERCIQWKFQNITERN